MSDEKLNEKIVIVAVPLILIGIFIGSFGSAMFMPMEDMHEGMSINDQRTHFIELKDGIQETMRNNHQYRCCLDKPCTYCIEKTPGHGEGAICDCLKDLMDGVHPCGECIGEILEGHGNKYLAEYFASVIAEKVGEEHLPALREIISEKYGIPIEKQI